MAAGAVWAAVQAVVAVQAAVVINEVSYHPPDDRDDLQFIELHNAGPQEVDVSGWALSKGVQFTFPSSTRIRGNGYLVVGRNLKAFQARYGTNLPVVGPFKGNLSHGGERLQLVDAGGHDVDSVEYDDRAPWPMAPDGYGPSLERICPSAGSEADNWAGSQQPRGTPGAANSAYSARPLPMISGVRWTPPRAGEPIPVTVLVADASVVRAVELEWMSWDEQGRATPWSTLPMEPEAGDASQSARAFDGSIPPQPAGRIIRFKVRAQGKSGEERVLPAASEPRPAFSCSTFVNTNLARIPFLQVMTPSDPSQPAGSRPRSRRGGFPRRPGVEADGPEMAQQWTSTVVYSPARGTNVVLRDFVQVRPRHGGWKLHFHSDEALEGMTGLNVIFESSRYVLAEPLAYQVYRNAGVPTPAAGHVRLWMNGHPQGYHLFVEQPNRNFLRRNQRDESGNLYKLLWYGNGVIGQHEKKTNPRTGHQDLIQTIEGLNRSTGNAQWEFIQTRFNVEEVASYFAVNMCIQNWDGFFNNYYAYHDLRPGGKWEIIPWDEDKTWGDYDGASSDYDWYGLPLTFGMNGDRAGRSWMGGGPYGGASWWRPPGYFSGPLLANPQFRKRFLDRLRELCEKTFTPEKFGPAILSMRGRLEPEVAYRARLTGQDPTEAIREFQSDIASFVNQLERRRSVILKQLR